MSSFVILWCAGYSAKLGDCSDTPSGSWADYVLSDKLPTKFIVSADLGGSERADLWRRMLEYAQKGDSWHDSTSTGKSAEPLVRKTDAAGLASTIRRLCGSPALSASQYADMVGRLTGFAARVEEAMTALPA